MLPEHGRQTGAKKKMRFFTFYFAEAAKCGFRRCQARAGEPSVMTLFRSSAAIIVEIGEISVL